MQYRFLALVFPDHALYPAYEIERSRISKLCLTRRCDDVVVYQWDRGLDLPTFDPDAEQALRLICERLATIVDRALAN